MIGQIFGCLKGPCEWVGLTFHPTDGGSNILFLNKHIEVQSSKIRKNQ